MRKTKQQYLVAAFMGWF